MTSFLQICTPCRRKARPGIGSRWPQRRKVDPDLDPAGFCRVLLAALERSEDVCRQHGIRFEGAVLKADLERELNLIDPSRASLSSLPN